MLMIIAHSGSLVLASPIPISGFALHDLILILIHREREKKNNKVITNPKQEPPSRKLNFTGHYQFSPFHYL
ncbi:hypothetical protein VNO77_21048 [Canavalia gladiata]|uniref:Uncharacterized protein n=1 Tax=Canavalia gladiata TaxID=3824 RepID=A0AAN9LR90_CANGL